MSRPRSRAPEISVIVPMHDVEAHAGPCLESLARQRFEDFEVLAIDDGSRDATRARAEAAARGDPRFRILSQANRGLSGARNVGLDLARGACIAFVDGDDRVSPDYLSRLHAALHAEQGDWAACGVRFTRPDGSFFDHSAVHGRPELVADPEVERLDFGDWREVVRHFPSAWNKLYRRRLIEGLQFDEGLYYEDHAFFQRAAARTDHMLRAPLPLYLQTRGRPGQITGEDSERVFEQLRVLEICEGILRDGPGKRGAAEGFARLASRLLCERAEPLRDPGRRARWRDAAREFLAARGLDYQCAWDPTLSRVWGLALAGEPALSLVMPAPEHGPGDGAGDGAGDDAAWARSAAALAAMSLREAELLVPPAQRAAMAAASGLETRALPEGAGAQAAEAAARGRFRVRLAPGDAPSPEGYALALERMLSTGAELAVCAWREPGMEAGAPPETGFLGAPPPAEEAFVPAPEQALGAFCPPGALIRGRGLEAEGDPDPDPLPDPLPAALPPGLAHWLEAARALGRARRALRIGVPVLETARPFSLGLDPAAEGARAGLEAALDAAERAQPRRGACAPAREALRERALRDMLAAPGGAPPAPPRPAET